MFSSHTLTLSKTCLTVPNNSKSELFPLGCLKNQTHPLLKPTAETFKIKVFIHNRLTQAQQGPHQQSLENTKIPSSAFLIVCGTLIPNVCVYFQNLVLHLSTKFEWIFHIITIVFIRHVLIFNMCTFYEKFIRIQFLPCPIVLHKYKIKTDLFYFKMFQYSISKFYVCLRYIQSRKTFNELIIFLASVPC